MPSMISTLSLPVHEETVDEEAFKDNYEEGANRGVNTLSART